MNPIPYPFPAHRRLVPVAIYKKTMAQKLLASFFFFRFFLCLVFPVENACNVRSLIETFCLSLMSSLL